MKRRPALAILGIAVIGGIIGATAINANVQPGQNDFERMGRIMVEELMSTPGCLGVETAQTSSGKNVIFAWFKDKDSAIAWHTSPTHVRIMDRFFPDRPEGHIPLEHIADDAGPLLVIASIKPATNPLPGTQMPISEIAIETYLPLPGGLRINGGFTPAAVPVRGRNEVTIGEPPAAEDR